MSRYHRLALGGACSAALLSVSSPAHAVSGIRSVFYKYDVMGRQTEARFDNSTGADAVVNQYNGFGELTSSSITMSGFSAVVGSAYDGAGHRTSVTHPDGYQFTYNYDPAGRPNCIFEGLVRILECFTYNDDGTLASRIEGSPTVNSVSYSWDGIGRLTGQSDSFSVITDNVGWTFGINPASQITSETRSNDAYAYGGLAGVNRNYAINGLNQYTSTTPSGGALTSYNYDTNGNLISDGTHTYTYDVENRLVQALSGTSPNQVTVSLTYDPLGRLYRILQQTGSTTNSDTQFVYDGDALIDEYTSGYLTNRYVHGSNAAADDPYVWYAGSTVDSTTRRWLHADHLGSIIASTNCKSGTTCKNSYDEYGMPGSSNSGRFQYTGQAYIPELGMYYYKARMYSATLGRFMQTDPIGYKDELNLYAYVGNDPVDHYDPSGDYACSMNEAGCGAFLQAQEAAKAKITQELAGMKKLQSDLAKGAKLSGSERQLQARIDKYVGPKAGSDRNALSSLIKKGEGTLSALQSWKQVTFASRQTGTDYAIASKVSPLIIQPSFFARGFSMQAEIVAHEGSHDGANAIDVWGHNSYGEKVVESIAQYGPNLSLQNADNVAFAFGFHRDDD